MQCSRTFLFKVCLSLVVSMGSCSCKPLNNDVPLEDPEGHYPEQDLLEEGDTEARLEDLLGTMKEGFLRKLNMSDVPQTDGRIYPPQFMMELYNKYASNSTAIPQSDVIRSFTVQDITYSASNGTKSVRRLLFNVSVPNHEKVTAAELRLFLLPDVGSRVSPHRVKATVKVYQVNYDEEYDPSAQLLAGKVVASRRGSWEKFDVTRAVQRWIKTGRGESEFEVMVDNRDCFSYEGGFGKACCWDISVSIGDNASAALIVFSDDLESRKREAKKELKEMILHEEDTAYNPVTDWQHLPNEIPESESGSESSPLPRPRRTRRKAEREYCRKTSLKVTFKDIGWDSWIVAPPEYDAFECRGQCFFPLTDEMTPSKHALIQTLINIRNPKKANMACCVPIKLDPITVMYRENGRLTIRHLYEEMKVAECGCR